MILRKKEKLLFKDACGIMRSKFSDEFIAELEHVDEGFGIMMPYMMTVVPFIELDGKYVLQFSDKSIHINKNSADLWWYIYVDDMTYDCFAHRWANAPRLIGDYKCSSDFAPVEKEERENGQSKLCISTLETLCDSEPEMHILVIGSSSEDTYVCGKSYEMLLDFLGIAGYYGSMLLVDPYEVPMVRQVGSFHLRTLDEKYDYKKPYLTYDGKTFTHVIEDVWVPTHTKDLHDPLVYDRIRLKLREGRTKFAYRMKGSDLEFVAGLEKHKDLEGGLGGGVMVKNGRVITVAGTSNRLGPFDPRVVADALNKYDYTIREDFYKRGRQTWDPDGALFDLYPDARISCKYYGEGYDKGIVRDQIWYTGLEKRLFYNIDFHDSYRKWGCGCKNCKKYGYIVSHFKVYTDKISSEDLIRGMLSRVIQDPCLKLPRYKYNLVISDVLAAAHKNVNIDDVIHGLAKKHKVRERTVERAVRVLRNTGKLGVEGVLHCRSDYTIENVEGGRTRWFSTKKASSYMMIETDRDTGKMKYVYYKGLDREVSEITYRPGVVDEYEEIKEWYIENFGSLFSSFDGDIDSRLTGRRTVGRARSNHYVLEKGGDLYPYKGYGLSTSTDLCPY